MKFRPDSTVLKVVVQGVLDLVIQETRRFYDFTFYMQKEVQGLVSPDLKHPVFPGTLSSINLSMCLEVQPLRWKLLDPNFDGVHLSTVWVVNPHPADPSSYFIKT